MAKYIEILEDLTKPILPIGIIMVWITLGEGFGHLSTKIATNYFWETTGLLYTIFLVILLLIKMETSKDTKTKDSQQNKNTTSEEHSSVAFVKTEGTGSADNTHNVQETNP